MNYPSRMKVRHASTNVFDLATTLDMFGEATQISPRHGDPPSGYDEDSLLCFHRRTTSRLNSHICCLSPLAMSIRAKQPRLGEGLYAKLSPRAGVSVGQGSVRHLLLPSVTDMRTRRNFFHSPSSIKGISFKILTQTLCGCKFRH